MCTPSLSDMVDRMRSLALVVFRVLLLWIKNSLPKLEGKGSLPGRAVCPYIYETQAPLQELRSFIRLLYLEVCQNTGENPVYEALSYTWGSPEKSKLIIMNNCFELRIAEFLFNVLRDP